MCGIFGTTNPKRDLAPLLVSNATRGIKAISLFSPHYRIVIDNFDGSYPKFESNIDDEPWILGHVQAPTGEPNADRHPFQWRNTFVAHNGVIHNAYMWDQTLGQETDSAVLPKIISQRWADLGKIQGTFACWAYNYSEKQTYLFRWVNPLYINGPKGWFSSTELFQDGGAQLEEGSVVKWPSLERIATFQPKEHPYR